MLVACAAWRHAAPTLPRRCAGYSTSSPSPRVPSPNPHPRHWINLSHTQKTIHRIEQRAKKETPRLSPLNLPKPPFHKVTDPTIFRHPSLKGHFLPAKQSDAEGESLRINSRARRRYGWESYERHELLGKQVIEMVITELLAEKYHKLAAEQIQRVRETLLSTANLSHLCQHYKLSTFLRADPVSVAQVAQIPDVQASLFCSYVAGLHFQEGMAYARQWLRQCFRSSINQEYDELRKQIAKEKSLRGTTTALYTLKLWLAQRNIEPQWRMTRKGRPPLETFKAELTFLGARVLGGGRNTSAAKENAAATALGLRQNLTALEDPDEMQWAQVLHAYCREREIKRTFVTNEVDNPVWMCTIEIGGTVWTAQGLGKRLARANCARLVLADIAPEVIEQAKQGVESPASPTEKAEEADVADASTAAGTVSAVDSAHPMPTANLSTPATVS
ncbi:hypothetical protein JCM11641_005062 [Rhodosporidiobolus odoratus]